MNNFGISKLGGTVIGLVAVAIIATGIGAVLNNGGVGGPVDDGIDVSQTPCEGIGAARQAVNDELQSRKDKAASDLSDAMEAASDNFWEENRRLENEHHECISQALLADPCKDLFEKASSLAQEILAGVEAGNGFDEAKFQEREDVKKQYDDCVANPEIQDDSYENQKAACDAALAAGKQANQEARQAAEAAAQTAHDTAVANAEAAAKAKHGQLDAIEEACNEPGGTTSIGVGGLTTGSTGTTISTGSACTGNFAGNDPELEATLRTLESQLNKARAAGLREGPYGTDHLSQAVRDARAELNASERTCEVDADCGDPEPVCCSGTSVGRVFCDAGVCANEVNECDDGEVCAGKPAQCVAASEGAQSAGVYLERTIPEVGTCSQKLQVLNLQQASPESVRYEIVGNIPSWVNIDKVGGSLPANVDVSYSCNTVQGFGPGTYTADGSITVYNANNELINTIPLNISITVTPVESNEQASAISIGSSGGSSGLSFTYNHASPVCPLAAGTINVDGPPGSNWSFNSGLPVWLTSAVGNSGSVPAEIPMQFPCQLEQYANQSLSTEVGVSVTTPDGTVQTTSIPVSANITGFEGTIEVRGLEGLKTN